MEKDISLRKSRCVALLFALLCFSTCCAAQTDIRWLREITQHRDQQLDGTMKGFTNVVYPLCIAVPASQLLYVLIEGDTTVLEHSLQTVASLGINTVLTLGVKYAVNRTRPFVTYPDIKPYQYENDPSFPSGHTSYAFSLATSLTLEYKRWYVAVPAYLFAGTVGYSRLYLGEHYPSDVAAGALIGAGSAWLSYKGTNWLLHHRNKHTQQVNIGD